MILHSATLIPRLAFRFFPFDACSDIPSGTLHLFVPLRQPIPKDDRWAGQIVHDAISRGILKIEARAKISSNSVSISRTPTLRIWFVISFLQDDKGMTTSCWYLVSKEHTPPLFLWKEQVTSMMLFGGMYSNMYRGRGLGARRDVQGDTVLFATSFLTPHIIKRTCCLALFLSFYFLINEISHGFIERLPVEKKCTFCVQKGIWLKIN